MSTVRTIVGVLAYYEDDTVVFVDDVAAYHTLPLLLSSLLVVDTLLCVEIFV